VLLYHGGVTRARGGFLGVDIFFVLSGYLITSLLLREHERTGTVALGAFWARRARRLLPALFLVLLFVCAYAAFAAAPQELTRIRGDALATLAYVANWRFIFSGSSYFDQFVVPSPLRHAWSLAIEEQWYVVWPLLLLFLLHRGRARGRRLAVAATVALTIVSVALMYLLFHPGHDPSRVYYGTDTRAQSLLVGALLAFVFEAAASRDFLRSRPVLVDVIGIAGAIALAVAIVRVPDTNEGLYRGGFLLVALAAAALVAAATQPRGVVRTALAWKPLCAIGIVSYGLYLWHWPIYVWLSPDRTHWHGNALLAARLAVTGAVAALSFVLVERPVRLRRWPQFAVGRVVAPAAALFLVVVILVSTAGATPGPNSAELAVVAREKKLADVPVADVFKLPRVLVVGDSVAFTFMFNSPLKRYLFTFVTGYGARWASVAKIGCGVASGTIVVGDSVNRVDPSCAERVATFPEQVRTFDPDLAVVMIGAWELYDHQVDGRTLRVGTPAYTGFLRGELERVVATLHARGARIAFTTVPCYGQPESTRGGPERSDPKRIAAVNRIIDQTVQAHRSYVGKIDVSSFLCPGGKLRDKLDGVKLRYDGVHYSPGGAALTWHWLGPRMAQLAHQATAARGHPGARR
jgi:peptidoglycan/LPS O-acetylase OafA/YrhL